MPYNYIACKRFVCWHIFQIQNRIREETQEEQSGVFLMTNMQGKAVNLYTGTIVTVLDLPYDIIKDVELRGWV